jgi:tryptophan-rich sensory protein
MKSPVIRFIIALILPLLVGGVAGAFTASAIPEWYATLRQPSFNPPNWVFGPVWTTLYLLMGYSFFRIWSLSVSPGRTTALRIYFAQLLLNFCWSFLFFYFKLIGWALLEIAFLWLSIVTMILHFYRLDRVAAYINIPYILWVSFASILNASYYLLNSN